MRSMLALVVALAFAVAPAHAAEEGGWESFGHALTLVQTLVGIAARSDNPERHLKEIDEVLAGRNSEANRAFLGLFSEATADLPPEDRAKVAAIGRDLTTMARRGIAKGPSASAGANDAAFQARKDLTAMGLTYHDPKQFLDAVARDDALAVELFIAGRGVNLGARDPQGRAALDIARANGNARMAELLARNLPAAR